MTTPREVRIYNEQEALIEAFRASQYGELLDTEPVQRLPDGVTRIGPYEVIAGQKPEKPVIRDAVTKRMVEGSGKYPASPDSAMTGRASGFRNTKEYREARERFDELFPLDGDTADIGSMAWFFDQIWQAAQGNPQLVPCMHDGCREKHLVTYKKDGPLLFKMMELRVGKAPQTVNINSHEEKIIAALEHRVIDVNIQGLDNGGVAQRQQVIEAFGYEIAEPV